jgi:hypothetical protein
MKRGKVSRNNRQSERSESQCSVSEGAESKTALSTLRLRPDLESSRDCLPRRQAGAQGDE